MTVVDKTNAVSAVVDGAKYENKYTLELAGIYSSFVVEYQYYLSNIKRTDKASFNSGGFYVIAKGILLSRSNYKYNKQTAGIDSPSNKALELAYSMLDLKNSRAGIYGGKMDGISIGLCFYGNKYITIRTSYITVKTRAEEPTKKVNAFQCRVQYYF